MKVMNWAIFAFVLVYGATLSSRRSLDQRARDLAQRNAQMTEHIVVESSAALPRTQVRAFENISQALKSRAN